MSDQPFAGDCDARVAFDLMDHISRRESVPGTDHASREYWLKLYAECLHVIHRKGQRGSVKS